VFFLSLSIATIYYYPNRKKVNILQETNPMGNSAGMNNVDEPVSTSINNCLVTLCAVHRSSGFRSEEKDMLSMLSVLAVLGRHDFEIRPTAYGNGTYFICQLRQGVPPWPSETLDRAMRDALPGNNPNPLVRWNFA